MSDQCKIILLFSYALRPNFPTAARLELNRMQFPSVRNLPLAGLPHKPYVLQNLLFQDHAIEA